MSEFKKKNKSNIWHSPAVLFALFCILIIFAYNMVGLIKKERDSSKKKTLILNQIDSLKNRESSLLSNLEKIKTDAGIEEIIRDKYQVAKQGEKIVVIVDENNKSQVSADLPVDHSFWGFIKKMFTR